MAYRPGQIDLLKQLAGISGRFAPRIGRQIFRLLRDGFLPLALFLSLFLPLFRPLFRPRIRTRRRSLLCSLFFWPILSLFVQMLALRQWLAFACPLNVLFQCLAKIQCLPEAARCIRPGFWPGFGPRFRPRFGPRFSCQQQCAIDPHIG